MARAPDFNFKEGRGMHGWNLQAQKAMGVELEAWGWGIKWLKLALISNLQSFHRWPGHLVNARFMVV